MNRFYCFGSCVHTCKSEFSNPFASTAVLSTSGFDPARPKLLLPRGESSISFKNHHNKIHLLAYVGFLGQKHKRLLQNKFAQMGSSSDQVQNGRIRALNGSAASKSYLGEKDGVIIIDHGSRRAQSNEMLYEFVTIFKEKTGYPIVEPAHMELADPTIEAAFDRCVSQGATRVIISPYFLFPGRHWERDIPALAAASAKKHPGVAFLVTAPIGLHELMVTVIQDRMNHCLSKVAGDSGECEMCAGTGLCQQRAFLAAEPRASARAAD